MIRAAQPADAQAVSALIVEAYQGYIVRLGRNPQPMDDDYASLIAAEQVWVMEREDSLVGVLVCQEAKDCLLVRTVAVAPTSQRKGIGSKLMQHAEVLAKDKAQNVLRLYTNETMTGNAELYARLGYNETHRVGPDSKQVIYMTKVL